VTFAKLLREHRRASGLTQEELAERARLSVRAISDLERGLKQAPRPSTVRLLVEALELVGEQAANLVAAAQPGGGHGTDGDAGPIARHNLPRELSTFVGRTQELEELAWLLRTTPLLTLVGPGGIGKTRLALRVAAGAVSEYPDGVWLVELASVSAPHRIPNAVAEALRTRTAPGSSPIETLRAHLAHSDLLLILDNCEHVVQVCAELVENLLRTSPGLRVLATSREPLGSSGELAWRVPSMAVPNSGAVPPVASLLELEGVRLFAERAGAARPSFRVSTNNAAAVAEICRRLDGIPLALELAAARVASMSVHQVAERLHDRFRLLTQGGRTAPPRQQTLRAAIDWSYELLTESERLLLDRLSVFAGGWTLEAAEAVCSAELIAHAEIADLLARLVARSLVLAESGPDERVRYRLLETMRQYAEARLVERGEVSVVRTRHLEFFLGLAEAAYPHLAGGSRQVAWMEQLDPERANLRLAMRWCLDAQNAALGLQLGGALWWFWFLRDSHGTDDGVDWSEAIEQLAKSGDRTAVRARALDGAAALASQAGDAARAHALQRESIEIWGELGDQLQIARSLNIQGWSALQRGDSSTARVLLEDALQVARQQGDAVQQAITLNNLGRAYGEQGDESAAWDRHRLALELFRNLGDRHGTALSLSWLCHWGLGNGDRTLAIEYGQEAGRLLQTLGARRNLVWTLVDLAVLLIPTEPASSLELLDESLRLAQQGGETRAIVWCLEALAGLVLTRGATLSLAARLLESASGLAQAIGYVPNRLERELVAKWSALAQAPLDEGDDVVVSPSVDGHSIEHLVAEALEAAGACAGLTPQA
jgi:predicted ATPase/DNA-binding XRE family transcriptional regulator